MSSSDEQKEPTYQVAGVGEVPMAGVLQDYDRRVKQTEEVAGVRRWWLDVAGQDVEKFAPKLAEYGSHDLLIVGAGLLPTHGGDAPLQLEAGVAFYALGKAARAVEALREGRTASPDTWLDLVTYGMMARRIQATGKLEA